MERYFRVERPLLVERYFLVVGLVDLGTDVFDERDCDVDALDDFDLADAAPAELVRAVELDRLTVVLLDARLVDLTVDLLVDFALAALTRLLERLDLEATALERLELLERMLRALRALRRVRRTAGFQPSARSARNDAGMVSTWSMSSIDNAAASARSARTSAITFAGRRARAACTRLVSSTTNIWRSGSIQSDVPV